MQFSRNIKIHLLNSNRRFYESDSFSTLVWKYDLKRKAKTHFHNCEFSKNYRFSSVLVPLPKF